MRNSQANLKTRGELLVTPLDIIKHFLLKLQNNELKKR